MHWWERIRHLYMGRFEGVLVKVDGGGWSKWCRTVVTGYGGESALEHKFTRNRVLATQKEGLGRR